MIRRTVAKAFGPSGSTSEAPEAPPPPAAGLSRAALVNRLFTVLHSAFEKAALERTTATAGGGSGTGAVLPPFQVTKTNPRPEGLEFLVEGAAGSARFLNSMTGYIKVQREEKGRFVEDRLLAVHFDGGWPRPIERPAGVPRAPFRFTSVPQVVREQLSMLGAGAR